MKKIDKNINVVLFTITILTITTLYNVENLQNVNATNVPYALTEIDHAFTNFEGHVSFNDTKHLNMDNTLVQNTNNITTLD